MWLGGSEDAVTHGSRKLSSSRLISNVLLYRTARRFQKHFQILRSNLNNLKAICMYLFLTQTLCHDDHAAIIAAFNDWLLPPDARMMPKRSRKDHLLWHQFHENLDNLLPLTLNVLWSTVFLDRSSLFLLVLQTGRQHSIMQVAFVKYSKTPLDSEELSHRNWSKGDNQ